VIKCRLRERTHIYVSFPAGGTVVDHASQPRTPRKQDHKPPRNWLEIHLDRIKRHVGFTTLGIVFTVVVALGAFTDALAWTVAWGSDRCRAIGVCAPLPPMWLVGTLTEVRLGASNVSQAVAWAEGNLATPAAMPPREAVWPGRFVTYRVEFRGLVGAVCFVRWTLLDATTGERIEDRWNPEDKRTRWMTVHAPAFPDTRWTVEANQQDAATGTLWVPYVAPGSFVVEVELLDGDGEYLDIERTPVFTVTEDDLP
jgi:hypothetical protein